MLTSLQFPIFYFFFLIFFSIGDLNVPNRKKGKKIRIRIIVGLAVLVILTTVAVLLTTSTKN